jgi:GAF domain-containing protein
MLSFRLFIADDLLGALNLHAARPGAFTDTDATVGELLAAHAAVAVVAAEDRSARGSSLLA